MAYHLIPGFIVRIGESSAYRHVQGGPCAHHGAECPTCQRPLVRIWQFDCNDPRFIAVEENGAKAFGDLATLPLYFCWTCGSELTYSIVDETSIEVLRSHGGSRSDDFPYSDYPTQYVLPLLELE
jgi:hypothetical protein